MSENNSKSVIANKYEWDILYDYHFNEQFTAAGRQDYLQAEKHKNRAEQIKHDILLDIDITSNMVAIEPTLDEWKIIYKSWRKSMEKTADREGYYEAECYRERAQEIAEAFNVGK